MTLKHPPSSDGRTRLATGQDITVLVICLGITALLLANYWIGFRGYADEVFLIRGALGWLEAFPYVGTTHWELRHPYVLSVATSVALFGKAEWSFMAPNFVALAVIVSASYWLMRCTVGAGYAAASALLVASTPLVIASATTLMPDLLEAFFVLASFAVFFSATRSTNPAPLLVAAGLIAGLAFVTRETSVALLIFFLGAFLVGYRLPRLNYLWLAAGFVPVWLSEVVYLFVSTGDPLYRYIIDFVQYHPPIDFPLFEPKFDNPEEVQFARDKVFGIHDQPSGGGDSHPPGPVDFGKALNSIGYLFVNHEYGALWVIGLPACMWALLISNGSGSLGWIRPLAILLIVWFVMISYVFGVRPIPRYYVFPTITISLISTAFFYRVTKPRLLGTILILGLLFVNLLATDLRTPRALYERAFLNEFATLDQAVYTRDDAAPLIRQLATLKGQAINLKATPPRPGDLFLYLEKRYGRDTRVDPRFLPTSEWEDIYIFHQNERMIGRILSALLVDRLLPITLLDQLRYPEPNAKLMRVH